MIILQMVVLVFVVWQGRRGVMRFRRARRAFDARVAASKLHLLDPHDQMKVFLTERDLLNPSQAFDEAYRTDDAQREAAKADEIVARAMKEKDARTEQPQPQPHPVAPEARSFGRRRAG